MEEEYKIQNEDTLIRTLEDSFVLRQEKQVIQPRNISQPMRTLNPTVLSTTFLASA
jgi:hypothetical protein